LFTQPWNINITSTMSYVVNFDSVITLYMFYTLFKLSIIVKVKL